MSRGVDQRKLLDWRLRLERFETSGLSVAAFCRKQKIAPTQFYYWTRRVREAGGVASSKKVGPEDSPVVSSQVEIFIGDSIRVCLPSSDGALVSAIVEHLRATANSPSGFERIDLVPTQ
jgi:transposase-like protein